MFLQSEYHIHPEIQQTIEDCELKIGPILSKHSQVKEKIQKLQKVSLGLMFLIFLSLFLVFMENDNANQTYFQVGMILMLVILGLVLILWGLAIFLWNKQQSLLVYDLELLFAEFNCSKNNLVWYLGDSATFIIIKFLSPADKNETIQMDSSSDRKHVYAFEMETNQDLVEKVLKPKQN